MNHILKLRNCRLLMKCAGNTLERHFMMKNFYKASRLYYFPDYSFSQIRAFAKGTQGKMKKGGKLKSMQLSDEEMAEVIDIADYQGQLHTVLEKLKKDYVEHLSVRSVAGNIDKLMVKIDSEEYPLNELAVISKKNQNLIAINLTDFPEGLKPTMQAILDSGAALNPQQDGTMIYLTVPKITREHRENLAKSAKALFIKAKEEVRAIQNFFVKDAKEKTELSEDLVFSATNQIRLMAERCVTDLEKVMKTKQKELLGDS